MTTTSEAILATLISPNVSDSNFESANVVDALANVANGLFAIRNSITPSGDGTGHIESLTEAVMDVARGLFAISTSLNNVADALSQEAKQ